ncbi:MAG: hypothetical protein IPL32_11195 [Chloracidobacterium sp.]|nr:hypothetical protein [Chloracidobacterium sp.]
MVYPPVNAQIGPSPNATSTPNYGIYGTAPTPAGTPWTCGTPAYANLQDYPEVEGGLNYTLPLNGSGNFNFYYNSDGTGFLSGGGYRVGYLNSSGASCYGSGDIVTYSPNSNHTNGVQVRPFNSPPSIPYGVHGFVLAKIPGGGGSTTPLANATASLANFDTPGLYFWKEKTNGIGYVSIYYSSDNPDEFLPYGSVYDLKISGIMSFGSTKCTFIWNPGSYDIIWVPAGGYLHDYDFGTITITSSSTGCAP